MIRPLKSAIIVAASIAAGMLIQHQFNIIRSFTEHFEAATFFPEKDSSDNINDKPITVHNVGELYGLPVQQNIISHEDYIVGYNYHLRQSVWSIEVLTAEDVVSQKDVIRQKCSFSKDPNIPEMFSSKNSDYINSGFDRGHLAAAANHRKSQDAMCSTFFLTNVSPQVGKGFNQRIWSHLEQHCRREVKKYKYAVVITGPLFISQNYTDNRGDNCQVIADRPESPKHDKKYVQYRIVGQNDIIVPTHFFKVFLGVTPEGRFESQSYIIKNEEIPEDVDLISQLASLELVEKLAGIVLFERIPRNKIIPITPKIAKFIDPTKKGRTPKK